MVAPHDNKPLWSKTSEDSEPKMTALMVTNVSQDNPFKISARCNRVFEKWHDKCGEMLKQNTANTPHGLINKTIL